MNLGLGCFCRILWKEGCVLQDRLAGSLLQDPVDDGAEIALQDPVNLGLGCGRRGCVLQDRLAGSLLQDPMDESCFAGSCGRRGVFCRTGWLGRFCRIPWMKVALQDPVEGGVCFARQTQQVVGGVKIGLQDPVNSGWAAGCFFFASWFLQDPVERSCRYQGAL